MNKDQILEELKLIDSLDVQRSEYIVTYGAALVLQGVKPETRDIDIYVPNLSILKLLAIKGYENLPFRSGQFVKITENMDFFTGCMSVVPEVIEIEGFQVQTVQSVYDEKEARAREKDLEDLPMIQEWLENH